jgi:anti-sigma factor RsiW
MTCVSHDTLQTYIDNELEPQECTPVAAHLRECATCSRELANVVRLKRATQQAGRRFTAPAALQRKIMQQVSVAKPQRWWTRIMVAMPAAALLVLIAASLLLMSRDRATSEGRELADLHVATLASANPVDVISTDKHTVKPWFAGKLPFTFNIPDLQGSQYELIGGRMAYIGQSPAAQLVFKYQQHRVSIFIVQEGAAGSGVRGPTNFTVLDWRTGGLAYFLVTDASPDTMTDLVQRMKQAAHTS